MDNELSVVSAIFTYGSNLTCPSVKITFLLGLQRDHLPD
jgi:hypothetical protein